MCDLATAAAVAGLTMSTVGGIQGARAQRNIGAQNAAIARSEAQQQAEVGRAEELRARSRMDRLIARQRSQLAARGVRLDSVSAEDLGAEAAAERAIEGQAARYNTESRSASLTNEARLNEYRGRMGYQTGLFRTAGRTLTGSLDLWPELMGG